MKITLDIETHGHLSNMEMLHNIFDALALVPLDGYVKQATMEETGQCVGTLAGEYH